MILYIYMCSILIHFLQARLIHFDFDKDYDDYRLDHVDKVKKNLRQSFLPKKKEHDDESVKKSVLDQLLETTKTEQSQKFEEIQHTKVDENNPDLTQIMKIENDFKSMLSQNNVKYYYKRDMYWRTWRSVKYGNEERMIFYKYHDLGLNGTLNCTLCEGGGFWDIVKPQSCAIEILSMKKNEEFCAVYHYELNHHFNSCPRTLKYLDFTGICDNPMVTRWIFEMTFSKDNKRNLSNILSGGKRKFELLTLYRIKDNEIIFQIINASNHVVYSKIMTKDNTSYACISNCGEINPYYLNIQHEKRMIDDLSENSKQKRHDKMSKELINGLKTTQVLTEKPDNLATMDEDVKDKGILASNNSRMFSNHKCTTVSLSRHKHLHHTDEDLENC